MPRSSIAASLITFAIWLISSFVALHLVLGIDRDIAYTAGWIVGALSPNYTDHAS